MTKILMIQVQPAPYAGTAYLNGAAISSGHRFFLHIGSDFRDISNKIRKIKPDLIGFSCMSGLHTEMLSIARKIKQKFKNLNIPVLMGGPHPTLFPEVINDKGLDIICRGEAEFAFIELLNALQESKSIEKIKNLWVKKGDKIYKNEMRSLVDPLDNIPLINWSCYKNTEVINYAPVAFLIRGCPYSCSYCFNQTMRGMYKNKGPYVRHFSVERSLKEIKQALKVFKPNPVLFTSDSFGIDLEWMERLLSEYTKMTELPYVLLLRPELASDKCIDILAKYNCYSVAVGVESGSERVRKDILNRHYSNEVLYRVAKRLHKNRIKFRTYNMMGLPTETEDEIWETINVNVRMKTDFPRGAIFTPMPNTKIVDIAKHHGNLDADFSFDTIPNSILAKSILKNVDNDRIQNTLYFFQTAIIMPGFRRIIRQLTKFKPNFLFRIWFYLIYTYLHRKSEKRALIPYLKFLFSHRKYR